MKTTRIKITDDRQGRSFRAGVNGRYFDLQVNQEIEVEQALADHLKSQGVAFDEVGASGRASSTQEGSGVGLAPLGPHDVRAPGTDTKSVGQRPLMGDQPGDPTESGGVAFASGGGASIEEEAEISDIRVMAERAAPQRAPVAEIAGEGESGTPKAKTQGVAPTHKETSGEKANKAASSRSSDKQRQSAKSAAAKSNKDAPSSVGEVKDVGAA